MAGTPHVHAHVNLIFRNSRGERFMVQRKLMVSTKADGSLTMKTVEGILYKDDPQNRDAQGNNPALSGRCNEVDDSVPRELGVSKAILENVIFCHQEDSNWPMSEPAKLKVKFDEIFQVTKWTKALAEVNLLAKERGVQYKVDAKELEALQKDTEIQAKLERKIGSLQADVQAKQDTLAELNQELKQRARYNQSIADRAAEATKAIHDLKFLEDKLGLHRKELESLGTSVDLLQGSDSELQSRLDGFQEYLDRLDQEAGGKQRAASEVRDKLDTLDRDASIKHSEQGGLQSRVRSYHEMLDRRRERVRVVSKELHIRGFDLRPLSQAESNQFDTHLASELARRTSVLESATAEAKKELTHVDQELSTLQGQERQVQGAKTTLQSTLQQERAKLQQLEAKVQSYVLNETSTERVKDAVQVAETRLAGAKDTLAKGNFDTELLEARTKSEALEAQVEQLNTKLRAFNASASIRATLELKQKEQQDKLNQASELASVTATKWNRYVGATMGGMTASDASDQLGRALREQHDAVAQTQRDDKEAESQLQSVQNDLNLAQRNEQEAQAKIRAFETKFHETLAGLENEEGEFEGSIERAFNAVRNDVVGYEGSVNMPREPLLKFFTEMHTMLSGSHDQHTPDCFACGRSIPETDKPAINQFLKQKIDAIQSYTQQQLQKEKEALAGAKHDLSLLEQLEMEMGYAKQWRTQVREAHEAVTKLSEQRMSLLSQGQLTQEAVQRAQDVLDQLLSLQATLKEYQTRTDQASTLASEAEQAQQQLEELGQTPEIAATIESELNAKIRERSTMMQHVSALEKERADAERAVTLAERVVHTATMKVVDTERLQSERIAAQQRVEEAQRDLNQVENKLAQSDQQLDQIKQDLPPVLARQKDARTELERVEKQHGQAVEQIQSVQRELRSMDQELHRMLSEGNERKLALCQDALAALAEDRTSLRSELARIESELSKISAQRNEAGATKRNLMDNLRYRETQATITQLQTQIDKSDLQSKVDALHQLNTEYDDLREQEQEKQGEAHHLRGELKGTTEQLKAAEREMREDYADAKKRMLKKMFEHKLDERANRDLKKLAQCIETSILQYHSAKMAQINENINYLWGKTYQGVDIEKILIKAEADKSARRSYNYRVVMVKGGAELDMRGRCSAGQKVLASIIIRLALADSFSMDCSLLALDEPTTNLDVQNIEALAKSLSDLIKERRADNVKSQLIVITHDEQFLSKLAENGVLEWYNRVDRDASGNSTIQRDFVRA